VVVGSSLVGFGGTLIIGLAIAIITVPRQPTKTHHDTYSDGLYPSKRDGWASCIYRQRRLDRDFDPATAIVAQLVFFFWRPFGALFLWAICQQLSKKQQQNLTPLVQNQTEWLKFHQLRRTVQ